MGHFIGSPAETATGGEWKFYRHMREILKKWDEVTCYYEPWLGDLHPDFLLLSPQFGVIVVEIKDYRSQTIAGVGATGSWEGREKETGEKFTLKNPFDQLYQYWRAVKDRINHAQLPSDIDVPVGRVAIFARILGDSPEGIEIRQYCPTQIFACFRETLNDPSALWEFLSTEVAAQVAPIEKKWFDLVQANLIPFSRLPTLHQAKLSDFMSDPDRVKLLDAEQEKLARELGAGHRIFFGVAGSGKTVLLAARARFLAVKFPHWHILVLCYNRLLSQFLFNVIDPQQFSAEMTVLNFHRWAGEFINATGGNPALRYKEELKRTNAQRNQTQFFTEVVPALLNEAIDLAEHRSAEAEQAASTKDPAAEAENLLKVLYVSQDMAAGITGVKNAQEPNLDDNQGSQVVFSDKILLDTAIDPSEKAPAKSYRWQYDAILIDEAQDFAKEWFAPVVRCLNPATDSLMVACDGLQGIYARKKFRWADVGIKAQGRTKRFTRSYRTPPEVGKCAVEMLPKNIVSLIDQDEDYTRTEEFVGDPGEVELHMCATQEEEFEMIAREIEGMLAGANPPDKIFVLLKKNVASGKNQHPLLQELAKRGIEWKDSKHWAVEYAGVLVGTLYGTKGLEADIVFIPQLDTFANTEDRQLLYVGATRARRTLVLSAAKSTPLVEHLRELAHSSD